MYVYLDGVGADVGRIAKQVVLRNAFRHDTAGPPQQDFEQLRLARGQKLGRIGHENLPCPRIECNVADPQGPAEIIPWAPQQCQNLRDQFFQRKRLRQVIVSPGLDSSHAILQSAAGAQYEYRRGILGRAQCPQGAEPVTVGKSEIENDRGVVVPSERFLGLGQTCGAIRHEPRPTQPLAKQRRQIVVILDDQ